MRHWVLIVSLDSRNLSERVDSVLIVPFGSQVPDGPTTLRFEPGETGLPRPLPGLRMRQVSLAI